MLNVLSQLIHLALAYVWLFSWSKATKQTKKGNKLAGVFMTESPTLVRHSSLTMNSIPLSQHKLEWL